MTETILSLVPTYGLWLLFGVGVLAAIGLPLPSTLTVMAVGAFVAGGDMTALPSYLTALGAAITGDQIGYFIGYFGGNAVENRLAKKPSRARRIDQSKTLMRRWGGIGVFLSRWLVAPIGPLINILTGASEMRWLRFSLWDLAGEIIWVSIYIGLGYGFRGNIEALAALLGNAGWVVAAALVAIFLGFRMLRTIRKIRTEGPTL